MKALHTVAYILMVVGGVNWGLVGLGSLMGGADWNVIHMVLGSWMSLEALVYILVGFSAVYEIAIHKKNCRICSSGGMM